MANKFKVGQKVKVKANGMPGDIIASTQIGRYHVKFKNGNAAWTNEAEIEAAGGPERAADTKKKDGEA